MTRTRQESLAVLADLLELMPEIRIGQLMDFMGFIGEANTGRKLGDIEDEELLDVLYQHRKDMSAFVAGREERAIAMPLPAIELQDVQVPGPSASADH